MMRRLGFSYAEVSIRAKQDDRDRGAHQEARGCFEAFRPLRNRTAALTPNRMTGLERPSRPVYSRN